MIEPFAGTDTWILSVDGDELYEPAGLRQFREQLEAGAFSDVFRIRPAGLHCDHLDGSRAVASGFLSPPSRPLVGALNFAAIASWSGVRSERLHGGDIAFRRGYDLDSWRHLGIDEGWDESLFRNLHVCFLRRSSSDPDDVPATGRANLAETRAFRRDLLGPLERLARRAVRRGDGDRSGTAEWKGDKYRRGDRVTVDVSPFFA